MTHQPRTPIEISTGTFFLIAHPIEPDYLYDVNVIMVTRPGECAFVVQQSQNSPDEPMIAGHESAICLQLLRSFSTAVTGMLVDRILFFAYYDGQWHKIHFSEFDPRKIRLSWPDCDSGDALGTPVIEVFAVKSLSETPLHNDFDSNLFAYYLHALNLGNRVIRQYREEIQDHYVSATRLIPFGDITYEAREHRAYRALFARHKSILKRRMGDLAKHHEIIFTTPLMRSPTSKAWSAVVVYVKDVETAHRILEPGHYIASGENSWLMHLREDLERCGVQTHTISEHAWKAKVHTELDLSKMDYYCRPFILLRRGEYEVKSGSAAPQYGARPDAGPYPYSN